MADLSSTRVFGKLTVMHEAILKANAEITGDVTASSFAGDGSLLTNLNASNLDSGTVPEARLPASALVGDTTYSAGTGITLSGTAFSLTDESYTSAEKTKLAGIEVGATADQTKADIDALNIDADTLDGQHGSYYLDYNNLSNKPQVDGFNWQLLTSSSTVESYDGIIANTAGGSFTVTLPSSPTTGSIVSFTDSTGSWETNNLIVDGGTNQVITTDTTLICDVNYQSFTLVYGNGKWNFAF